MKAKVYPVAAKVLFPNALVEIVGMTRAVTDSDLDWTIARIVDPNDKQSKSRLRVGFLGRDRIGSAVTRADIAAFLVAQLADDTYIGAMPAISN